MAIILRTSGLVNIFRDVMVSILSSRNVDEALLCSGFFQENFKNSNYQATAERNLALACAHSGVKLTTVGIHNSTWKTSYQRFRTNMVNNGANISCLYKPNMHWHAKVFIASSSKIPCFGIIGSSNITRNAFSTGHDYNNECDVFLWSGKSPIASVVRPIIDEISDQIVIRAPYVLRNNGMLSVSEQLSRIRDEVMSPDLEELS